MKEHLTHEQSLAIITGMISTAKGNFRQNSFYFLFWGWISIIASLGHFYLQAFTDYPAPYIVWLIAIPGWIISMIWGYQQAKKRVVKTYSDHLILWTWVAFTICILIIIFSASYINFQITPLILIFAGFATFSTGMIIRYKPLIFGGSFFWIAAPFAFAAGGTYGHLIMALAIIVGYLIPGYMLKNKKEG